MDNVNKLKEMIVELKLELIQAKLPKGYCPYSFWEAPEGMKINCDKIDCDECRQLFLRNMRKSIRKEIDSL